MTKRVGSVSNPQAVWTLRKGEAAAGKLHEVRQEAEHPGWTAGVEQHSRAGSTADRSSSVVSSSTAGQVALQIGAAQ